ncbi:MAG: CPBP family intramembrane metalloprotease [Candidatus Heimdallarchaeota archaeon]|nr:CPBP family intramembrane metalloprotease [Candidatus Heimdallarchaeota archaeon]MCG3254615.1 CPBP family intramembrane metalloprotease [Candidatus Heimdallarchaeota archaeon]MCK4609698.1 CPBP family intramembrane metalloprotease [Candidatus Heimdallarchaeota archaeon]
MQKRRFLLDSLLFSVSVFSFSIIRLVFDLYLLKNEANTDSLLYGVNTKNSIFLSIGIIILFFLYGWSLRRWFIKKNLESEDNSLNHIIIVFLPIFLILLIYSIIVSFLNLPELHIFIRISSIFLENLQLIAISTILGVFLFPRIENKICKLLKKTPIESKSDRYGLGLFPKQLKQNLRKFNNFLAVGLAGGIVIGNLIIIILYPSIKASAVEASLDFFYPNFWYHFDPINGLAQEFFKKTILPSNVVFDWKLTQAILSILLICLTFSILLLKKRNTEENNQTVLEKFNEKKSEKTQEDIAYQILNPEIKTLDFVPSHLIKSKTPRRYDLVLSRINNSNSVSVMKLILLSVFSTLFLISIFQNTAALGPLLSEGRNYSSFVHLTQSIWEGFGEEIMFRLLLFGLPLFLIRGLIYLIQKLFEYRSRAKSENVDETSILARYIKNRQPGNPLFYLTGGWGKVDKITGIFMIFSSIAYAYVQPAYGWNLWKMVYTIVVGFICGYAFCKFGIHTAIIINIATELILVWILVSSNGIVLNNPFLLLSSMFFGSILVINVLSLVLPKIFKLGNLLSN